MKKLSPLFVIPIILLGALVAPLTVHGATGQVSVNGGALVSAAQTATTVSVPIQVSGSDAFNAFDIQVLADPSVISGSSVSLTGGVLASPTVVLECINGVLIAGTVCSAQDGAGVVHLAVASNTLTAAPTSGLLFTITYNINGLSTGTPISFNTGCTKSSVAGVCVTLSNGNLPAPNSETALGANFANQIDFTIAPAFASVSTPSGTAINDVITLNAVGGYQDIVNVACAASAGQTCSLSASSVDLTVATSGTVTLTVTPTASGPVTVTGTGQGLFGPVKTHTTTVNVLVAAPDFSIALSKTALTIPQGGSDNSAKVNLQGVSGFSGTVTFTSSAGITGAAPAATLTPDASGYSTASSTLTVSVPAGTAPADYTVTITGTSGAASHSASLTVTVPGVTFTLAAVPDHIIAIRGGSAAANINVFSQGNFAGTVTLTAVVAPVSGQQDSCCLTNNITPAFNPATVTLTAGNSVSAAFFAATIGGSAPAASYTSTGNYTAVITATSGSVSKSVTIFFTVQDFALTASYCDWSTSASPGTVASSVDANVGPGIAVGNPCNTITITTGSGIQDPLNGQGIFGNPTPYVLWVQSNAYGGLVTDGFDGTPSVAALNPQTPPRGFTIPALSQVLTPGVDHRMCLLPTFFANGTQVPYPYLVTHGPLITPGGGLYVGLDELGVAGVSGIPWGCTFDAQTFPNDLVGEQAYNNHFMNTCDKDANGHCTDSDIAADGNNVDFNECGPHEGNLCPVALTPGNPDAFQVVAMSITDPTTGAQLTAPGAYTFQVCGQIGVLRHCSTFGLDVVNGAQISSLDFRHNISFRHSRPVDFTTTLLNPDSVAQYMQTIVSVTGDNGNTFTVVSPITLVGAGQTATLVTGFGPNWTTADIGHTFTFTETILQGASATGLTATSSQVQPGSGASASGSFVVKH